MTIFHVLKYPISDPVTSDELANIPDNVWEKWLYQDIGTCSKTLKEHLLEYEDPDDTL